MNIQRFFAQSIVDQIQGWCIDCEGKIGRIKVLRDRTGLGLRDAKECVEAWEKYDYNTDRVDAIEMIVAPLLKLGNLVDRPEPDEDRRLVWADDRRPYEAHSKEEACRFEAWLRAESSFFIEVRHFKQAHD